MTLNEIIIVLVIGLFAGLLSGSMGVGGGIIVIPSLVFILGFSMQQAQGTSLALMTIPVMLVATINYYREGSVDVKVALIMALTFIIGGYIGSKLSISIPEKFMKKSFGILMMIVALKMIISK
ncbi:MAG: sulfite exporter TauE/SafE family protein [Bacteroidales bacterium]|nr:sulfite exporter TauE/SafE family protein [Bacteroidales bacterium]